MPLSRTNDNYIDAVTLQRAQRFSQLVSLKNQLRRVSAQKERLESHIAMLEEEVKQDIKESLGE
jgi:hypothetical protein